MTHLKINRYRSQAQCFEERLSQEVGLTLMLIPAGTFLMGAPENEAESQERERPQHSVTLQTFFMGRYPVTQVQWRIVADFPKVHRDLNPDPSNFKGGDRPVEQVSWLDAVEFCQRLANRTHRPYRLPSEAEWEYACRAGTQTPFHFGETITTDLANYRGTDHKEYGWSGSYGAGPKGLYREETTPVGTFPANAYGLADMHGNVLEWCEDHWHDNYDGAPTDGSAWIDDGDRQNADVRRLLRGGSWYFIPWGCRSACRNFNVAGVENFNIGFRVVCSPARTP